MLYIIKNRISVVFYDEKFKIYQSKNLYVFDTQFIIKWIMQ